MKHIIQTLTAIYVLLALCSCGSNTLTNNDKPIDSLNFKYAKYIKVYRYESYRKAVLANPWKEGAVLHTYIIPNDSAADVNGVDGTVVRKPSERAAIFSSVHSGLLSMLGELDRIGGVCDAQYMNLPDVQNLIQNGKIKDFGNGMNPNIEQIITNKTDLLMVSPFEGNTSYGKIEQIGIPIIECADYAEVSAIARAEWMRFYGILFGCEKKADSLFSVVEKNYFSLKQKVAKSKKRPTILAGLMYQGVWYTPGGNSTNGQLFGDAGFDYPFKQQTEMSKPLSFEQVLSKSKDADVWVVYHDSPFSYRQMLGENAKYSQFKAFANRKVYNASTSELIYIEAPFRPDIMLKDLVSISNPDLVEKGYSPRYYKPVSE